jgi:hypothetical protein
MQEYESMTNAKDPSEDIAMPAGLEKLARVPTPSTELEEPEPARVVRTAGDTDMSYLETLFGEQIKAKEPEMAMPRAAYTLAAVVTISELTMSLRMNP